MGKMRKDFKSPPRRLRIAVWRISNCLRKTKVVCLGHLSHHLRQRQPRLRLRLHHHYRHVEHAAKDSMNPTPPTQRVDLPEVALPDPSTPNSEGELVGGLSGLRGRARTILRRLLRLT